MNDELESKEINSPIEAPFEKSKMKLGEALLIILGIVFISFNLRAPITAVGTIGKLIQTEFGLSDAVSGMITTIPLIAFAVVSPFVAKVSMKIGQSLTMLFGLIFILVGEIIRSYAGIAGLFIGTAIIGIGIAIGNVIIPAIIKLHFADKVGTVTSIYTTGMCTFAAVGAGISVPLAEGLKLGWHHALACWLILAVITIAIWLPQILKKKTPTTSTLVATHSNEMTKTSIWKSPLAWWVTIFMGVQSLIFYSLTHWISPIIQSKGLDAGFAGNMALTFQLMAIPATLIMPILTGKFKTQKGLVLATCIIYITGMLCFLFGANKPLIGVAVVLMSIGMGASISLSIAFISLRSPNSLKASELSGMSQSAGYLLAAVGPFLTGLLYDVTKSWTIPIVIFIVLLVFLAVCGMFAGTNKTVEK